MFLYLIQHAEAKRGEEDLARDLTEKGRIDMTCPPKTDPHVKLEWWIKGRQVTPGKCQICSSYFARASVERKIPDAGDRGTPGYRREWQEFFKPRRLDIL
jgi:hypothetical protein